MSSLFIVAATGLAAIVPFLLYSSADAIASSDSTPSSTIVIREANALANGWTNTDTTAGGAVSFVSDTTAPYGYGALQLTTTSATDSKARFSKTLGTRLADVKSGLAYDTKQVSASFSGGLPSFQLEMFLNNSGPLTGYTTLTYEPYVNFGNAAVQNGTWQHWDVSAGRFYSSRAVGTLVASQGSSTYTLDDILAQFPNAVVYKVGVNIGSNNPSYTVLTDGITVGGQLYDFEPVQPVLSAPTNLVMEDGAQGYSVIPAGFFGLSHDSNNALLAWDAVTGATGYTIEVYKDGVQVGGSSFGWNGSWVGHSDNGFGLAGDGSYTFVACATNPAAVVSKVCSAPTAAYIYDRTAPVVSVTAGAVSLPENTASSPVVYIPGAAPTTFQATLTDGLNTPYGAYIELFKANWDGSYGTWVTDNTSGAGNVRYGANPQLVYNTSSLNGRYGLKIVASDQLGNSQTTYRFFTVDSIAPATPTNVAWTTPDGVTHASGDATHFYSGAASWNANTEADFDHYVYKYWNDIPGNPYKVGSEYIISSTSTSLPGVFNQGQGVHYFSVAAVDKAGNESPFSEPFKITYDTTVVLTMNSVDKTTTTPTFSGTATYYADAQAVANTALTVVVNDTTYPVTTDALGNWSVTLPAAGALTDGQAYTVTVSDATGATVSREFTVSLPTDTSGSTSGGSTTNGSSTQTTAAAAATTVKLPATVSQTGLAAVLGDSTTGSSTSGSSSSSGTGVEGATTEKTAATAANTDASDGILLGLAWYWWLIILSGIALLAWWIIAGLRRRQTEE